MNEEDFEELSWGLDEDLFKQKLFPIVVRPNLGQPEFLYPLNLKNKINSLEELPEKLLFELEMLIACCDQSSNEEIIEEINNHLFIYPLSDKILNGRAKRFEKIHLLHKEELQPADIILIDDINYKGNPQLYLKTENVFPGRENFYFAKIEFQVSRDIFISEYHKKGELDKKQVTKGLLREFVLCDLAYDLTDVMNFKIDHADENYSEYLQDTSNGFKKKLMRTNYHALVLSIRSDNEWSNMKMWQVSDIHSAERNDTIFKEVLSTMAENGMREKDLEEGKEAKQFFEDYISKLNNSNSSSSGNNNVYGNNNAFGNNYDDIKLINDRFQDKSCYAYKINEDLPYGDENFFWKLPVEYRIQNYNNNFRMLIFQANDAIRHHKLDFITITGDLIDYVTPRGAKSYEFKYSNWKNFVDMVIGKPRKAVDESLLDPEELLVPIFTIPGNHDYRGRFYPPFLLNAHYGLKSDEIHLYSGAKKFSSLRSLQANIKYLTGYFQFINPDLNFTKKFGNTHLIFMDTDKDSILDFYDLIKGSPSTRGIRDDQMNWLRRYCNNTETFSSVEENVLILSHSPPLNPPKLEIIKHILDKLFPELYEEESLTGFQKIFTHLLKEYFLADKLEDPRIDPFIDLKFGTFLKNYEDMLEFLLNFRTKGISRRVKLYLTGHTHKNLEFRIETLKGRELSKIPYIEIVPFFKIKIPCAVYMGNYSSEYKAEIEYLKTLETHHIQERLTNDNLIVNQYPFIVHTPSLGPRSDHEDSQIQGYRQIIINHDRIDDFSVIPLIRYFIPFEKIANRNKK